MSSTTLKPNILIVEDEEALLQGLSDLFIYKGYAIDTAIDGMQALEKWKTNRYHLIVLDIMLPGRDGFSICREIRSQDRELPILLLTAKGDEADVVHGLEMGADDYLRKPFSVKELLARVEALLRRNQRFSLEKEKIHWRDFEIDTKNLILIGRNGDVKLTRREVEILRYLILHQERPVSRQELLKEVWGYAQPGIDTRTVDIHITKLRRKIEADPQHPDYLLTLRGEGYRLR